MLTIKNDIRNDYNDLGEQIKTLSDATTECFETKDSEISDINTRIDNIKECHCDPEVMKQLVCDNVIQKYRNEAAQLNIEKQKVIALYNSLMKKSSGAKSLQSDSQNEGSEIIDPASGSVISLNEFIEILNNYGIKIYDDTPDIDTTKPVYGTMELKSNLIVNGLINGVDINNIATDDSNFSLEEGYPKFQIKNSSIIAEPYEKNEKKYHALKIQITDELKKCLLSKSEKIDI